MVFLLEHVMLLLVWPVFKSDLFLRCRGIQQGVGKKKKKQDDGT